MSFDIPASKGNLVRSNGKNVAPANGQGCFELHTAGSPPPSAQLWIACAKSSTKRFDDRGQQNNLSCEDNN